MNASQTAPLPPRWIATRIALTSDAKRYGARHVCYPLHVEGMIAETGEIFSWAVPAVDPVDYDLAKAEIEPAAAALIGVPRK